MKIKLKRNSVSGIVPSNSELTAGELAVNTADGKVFLKKDDGTIIEIGSGGGGDNPFIAKDIPPYDFVDDEPQYSIDYLTTPGIYRVNEALGQYVNYNLGFPDIKYDEITINNISTLLIVIKLFDEILFQIILYQDVWSNRGTIVYRASKSPSESEDPPPLWRGWTFFQDFYSDSW